MGMMHDGDVVSQVLFAIACGVATRLSDSGWTPAESPALGSEFVRGDDRIDPMQHIFALAGGQASVEEWASLCAKAGLSGPLA